MKVHQVSDEQLEREDRMYLRTISNDGLAHRLITMADNPGSFSAIARRALLYVAAERIDRDRAPLMGFGTSDYLEWVAEELNAVRRLLYNLTYTGADDAHDTAEEYLDAQRICPRCENVVFAWDTVDDVIEWRAEEGECPCLNDKGESDEDLPHDSMPWLTWYREALDKQCAEPSPADPDSEAD